MKTKKLLVMSNFVEAYRRFVREAYQWYVAYLKYDLSLIGNTEKQKNRFAMNAIHFATRAMAVYDCAFYTNIKGLASNLLDIQEHERERYDCLDDTATMENIQDWVWDYIEDKMLDIDDEYDERG